MLSLLHVWQTWLSHHRCGDVSIKAWGSVNVEEACVWMTQSRYLPSLCAAVTGDTCRRNPWMRTTNCHTRHLVQKEGFSECTPDLLCHYTQAFPVSHSLSLTGHTHTHTHTLTHTLPFFIQYLYEHEYESRLSSVIHTCCCCDHTLFNRC